MANVLITFSWYGVARDTEHCLAPEQFRVKTKDIERKRAEEEVRQTDRKLDTHHGEP